MAFQSNLFTKNRIQEWEDPCIVPEHNERKASAFSNKDLLRLSNNFHRVEFELKHPEGLSLESVDKGKLFEEALTRIGTFEQCLESDSDFGSPLKPVFQKKSSIFRQETEPSFEKDLQEVKCQFQAILAGEKVDIDSFKKNFHLLGAGKRKQSLQIKIGRKMSHITSDELDTLKAKASRRLSFRVSVSKEFDSANVSTHGSNTPQMNSPSVNSDSITELQEENHLNTYRGASEAFKKIKGEKFNPLIPKIEFAHNSVVFPVSYNFDSHKFQDRISKKSQNSREIDVSISGIRKKIKKQKASYKLSQKSSKASKKKKKVDKTPSILDKVFHFPSYSNSNELFRQAKKFFLKSRSLNKSSGIKVERLTQDHRQFQSLKSQMELESLTQGDCSVESDQFKF